jgi:hypothetical protein
MWAMIKNVQGLLDGPNTQLIVGSNSREVERWLSSSRGEFQVTVEDLFMRPIPLTSRRD